MWNNAVSVAYSCENKHHCQSPWKKIMDLGETSNSQREWCFSHVFLNTANQCPEIEPSSIPVSKHVSSES